MDALASLVSFVLSREASAPATDAACDGDESDGEQLDFDEEGEQQVASSSIIPEGVAKGKCLYMPGCQRPLFRKVYIFTLLFDLSLFLL